jgi:ubiquilin
MSVSTLHLQSRIFSRGKCGLAVIKPHESYLVHSIAPLQSSSSVNIGASSLVRLPHLRNIHNLRCSYNHSELHNTLSRHTKHRQHSTYSRLLSLLRRHSAKMADEEQPDAQLSFKIKTSGDKTHAISISETKTVLDLKNLLATEEYENVPVERQRLIYSGRVLKNEEALSAYKIKGGNTVHLVKSAASNAKNSSTTTGASALSSTAAAVPTNMAAGTANNPLAGLTGARYAGQVNLPSASMFGADGGMGAPPSDEQLADMLSDPNTAQMMNEALQNPQMIDQIIQSNPMLRNMPGAREILSSPMMRQMMTDPQMIRQAMRMQRNMGGGGSGAFPAPGATDTTPQGAEASSGQGGAQNARAGAGAGAGGFGDLFGGFGSGEMGPNPFAAMLGGGGAGGGAAANPFAAMLGGGAQGGGAAANPFAALLGGAGANPFTPPAADASGTANPTSSASNADTPANPPNAPSDPNDPANQPDPVATEEYFREVTQNAYRRMGMGAIGDLLYGNSAPWAANMNAASRAGVDANGNPRPAPFAGTALTPAQIAGLRAAMHRRQADNAPSPQAVRPGAVGSDEHFQRYMEAVNSTPIAPGVDMFAGMNDALGRMNSGQPLAPPEELYAEQLRALNEMGFYDFDRNVAALRRSGGSVQGAVEQLLG